MAEIHWFGGIGGTGGGSGGGSSDAREPDTVISTILSTGALATTWEDLGSNIYRAPLNTINHDNIGGFSLSSNIITFPAGTFFIRIYISAFISVPEATSVKLQVGMYNDSVSLYTDNSYNAAWLNQDAILSMGTTTTIPIEFLYDHATPQDVYIRASLSSGVIQYADTIGLENSSIPCYIGIWSATSSGNGGSLVQSVNGQTGTVVLDADDIPESATKGYIPDGGVAGQVLTKQTGSDFDVDWENTSGVSVTSVNGQTGAVQLNTDDIPVVIPELTVSPYGDLDVNPYILLDSGRYYMEGLGSDFSNLPNTLSLTPSETYRLDLWILNDVANDFHRQAFRITDVNADTQNNENFYTRSASVISNYTGVPWKNVINLDDTSNISSQSGNLILTSPGSAPAHFISAVDGIARLQGANGTTNFFATSGSPVGVITPSGGANLCFDTTNNVLYISNGATDTDWVDISATGGAVDSVNGQTGVVVLDADDISTTATRFYVPDGGTTGQVFTKQSNTDGDADWQDSPSDAVDSVNGQTGVVQLNLNDIPIDWTDLSPATYGDLNAAAYIALTSGVYRMTALGSELSNYPSSLPLTGGTTYILYLEIVNDTTNQFSSQRFVINPDSSTQTFSDIYYRSAFDLTDYTGVEWTKSVLINDSVSITTSSTGDYIQSAQTNEFNATDENILATTSATSSPAVLVANNLPETRPFIEMIRGLSTVSIYYGEGSPQGVVTPNSMGDVYIRTSGGPGIWFNLTGTSGGWRKGAVLHNVTSISSDGTGEITYSGSGGHTFNGLGEYTVNSSDATINATGQITLDAADAVGITAPTVINTVDAQGAISQLIQCDDASASHAFISFLRSGSISGIMFGDSSPIGVVTPGTTGIIYIDKTPNLWISNGSSDTSWRKTALLDSTASITSSSGAVSYSGTSHVFTGNSASFVCPIISAPSTSQGNIGLNIACSDAGYDYDYIRFGRGTPSEDTAISFGATSPLGIFTPTYIGQLFIDTSTPALWISTSLADDQSWSQFINDQVTAVKSPTYHYYTAGDTITVETDTPGATKYIVNIIGAGGSSAGSGVSGAGDGESGGNSVWDTGGTPITATGGGGSTVAGLVGLGGVTFSADTPTVKRYRGNAGEVGGQSQGRGGNSGLLNSGGAPPTNSLSTLEGGSGIKGGGGSGATLSGVSTPGGGGGEGVNITIPNPTGSYVFTLGAGGTAGTAGTSGENGGAGSNGYLILEAYYGTNP